MVEFRKPRITLFLLFWYFAEIGVSVLCWWFFYSREQQLLGTIIPNTHIAFNACGGAAYLLISAVFMFWPYRYGHCMLVSKRRDRFTTGIFIVYFLRDLPCWIIEFQVIWKHGFMSEIQGISFIVATITFAFATFVVWFKYTWRMAKYFQEMYGHMEGAEARYAAQSSMMQYNQQSMMNSTR